MIPSGVMRFNAFALVWERKARPHGQKEYKRLVEEVGNGTERIEELLKGDTRDHYCSRQVEFRGSWVDLIALFDQQLPLSRSGSPQRRGDRRGRYFSDPIGHRLRELLARRGDGDWIRNSHPSGIDSRLRSMAIGLQKMCVLTRKRAFYLAASHRQIKKSLLCVLGG